MTDEFMKAARERARVIVYPAGTVLAREGEECTRVGLIFQGSVSIMTLTDAAEEFLIARKEEGSCFGELLALSSHPYYEGTIRTCETSRISFFTRKEWIALNEALDPAAFLTRLADQGLAFQRRAKVLSQSTLADRVLFFLKSEHLQTGRARYVYTTKESLARLLALPRPSLSRTLSRLAREKRIGLAPHEIWLL